MALILLGAAVVAVTLSDLLSTTLSVATATGLYSVRFANLVWRGLLKMGLSHSALRHVGPLLVVALVTMWVTLLWVGWSLIFVGAGDAVVSTSTGAPAEAGQRVFFAGYLVSTLGNGDYTAVGTVWKLVSVAASLSGLLTATMAITFLVPVVSAVVHRRTVALQIAGLGDRPGTVLMRAWDGTDFSALQPHLTSVLSELHQLAQRHLAYPVLHYFHNDQRHAAIAPMVAVLDDTLLLLQHAAVDPGIDRLTLAATRDAVSELLALLRQAFISPSGSPPPAPDLDCMRELGAKTVDDDDFKRAVVAQKAHRCLMLGFVEADGWSWDEVHNP